MGTISSKFKKEFKVCEENMSSFQKQEFKQVSPVDEITNNDQFYSLYRLGPCMADNPYMEARTCFHRKTDIKRFVKIFRKDLITNDSTNAALEIELQILKSINHQNIVKLCDYFSEPKRIYVVSEFCNGGELFTEILRKKTFSEHRAALIIKQIFSGVAYLHQNQICHRNIKPENILMHEDENGSYIKLSHFGSALQFEKNKQIKGIHGSSYYISPEVLGGTYNENCDLWSCGVILYILLAGYPPFNGNNDEEVLERVKIGQYSLEDEPWPRVSADAKDLISKLLIPAHQRISAEEALRHKWILDHAFTYEINSEVL
ncbi:unnamed protein product [Blepharisma stoltei]|uniref:Protein kinase domain-containing protein n=1 Tax=Blepharisma stoltei TaxID=1481888 RepID=A0AAU9IGH7_9CILI|nr:unnamed protein product [Blepharisma stoltei]